MPIPQIRLYQDWLQARSGLSFDTYDAMWRWSVTDLEAFWRSIWDYSKMTSPTPFAAALAEERMPGAVWFPGAQVNYARQALRPGAEAHRAGHPAIIAENEAGEVREVSWPELTRQVASMALTLRRLGVQRGDRVSAYLPNTPEAVIAFLATASLGAIWSVCAPDMGVPAIVDRFRQIEPKVLIAADGVHYAGKPIDRSATVAGLRAELPSVQSLILLETPYAAQRLMAEATFADAIAARGAETEAFEPEWLPFDHPLWILYSSGTTGLPKPIVHGHGGVLMAAAANGLHSDLGASFEANTTGERFHWYSSTGWVMWNSQVGGLLSGSTICIYDGSPMGARDRPDWGVLWRFAAKHRVTYFGAGAAFYGNCMKAGVELRTCGDLSRIRVLGTTGSPLPAEVQTWGTQQFASMGTPDIWWYNISGGTDIVAAFAGGHRELPQQPGRMQCRMLGTATEAWDEDGKPQIGQVGELVCARPLPSMPLRFWNDPGGERYLSSYFDLYQGVWRHGDWLLVHPDGSCEISGRSDATINRNGVRMGTSEIYSAVERLPQILDSMVIELEQGGGESQLILFVVPAPGLALDEALRAEIGASIRASLSPRFIPDIMAAAPGIPRTLSGKKQELPIKRMMQGRPIEKVINREAMANPEVLDWYARFATGAAGSH
jgi:acetoacetyl-CoA synthetase